MNTDICMYCGKELIADTSAPKDFCSRICFDALVKKVKAAWDQRYREARAKGNGAVGEIKPLSEIIELTKPAAPKPPMLRRV